MANPEEINSLIKRIAAGEYTDADIAFLREVLDSGDKQATLQLGKYNVNIGDGKEIHIGNRNYYSWDKEALSALVSMIQFGDVDAANILLTKLNNAQLQGQEGDRKTGSFYTYNVWLEDVCVEKSHDSTENNRHIQKYTIQGKWNSRVYKEINLYGLRFDMPWGLKKKPYGNFTVTVEILNGLVTQIKVNAARHNDSANNYAADKAEQLINSKISPNGSISNI